MALARMLYILLFISLASICSYAQPPAVPPGAQCDECGMRIDQKSRFISEAVDRNGKKLFFCDIGDMLYHFRTDRDGIRTIHVKDYVTGEWIDGREALYIFNREFKSPMSWNIAAFSKGSDTKNLGSPVNFNDAFGLLK